MSGSVYIQLIFHSAQGSPLSLAEPNEEIDVDQFSINVKHLPKRDHPATKMQVKTYRLTAMNQFVHNTNYDSLDEVEFNEPLLINADDIQAFPSGILYSHQYIVCFNMCAKNLTELSFKIRVTLYNKGGSSLLECGSFHIGQQFKNNSTGSITGVLLDNRQDLVGTITFDYLICGPWMKYNEYADLPLYNMKNAARPIMIGHRGSGCSYCINPSKYMENTLNSFEMAEKCGADFIECDVQLTRDEAVVVFHDFLTEAILDVNRAKSDHMSRLEIPLRDLSHYQLIKNNFKHASISRHNDKDRRDTLTNDIGQGEKIFPLISEIILSLPPKIGVNVEVKFPQQESNGTWELEGSYFDRNTVVERVLEEVFRSNSEIKRPIIFSSFDPAVCVMLRQKQKHYPVMFLITPQDTPNNFMDFRCRSIKTAITFCLAEKLHGVAAEADHILNEISRITRMVHSNKLYLITWGQANNSVENIGIQVECKVDGIIFDRIYDILPGTK